MFGKPFPEVHAFLDQYFAVFGVRHRVVLHHRKGIELLNRQFPGPVRKIAEQHIIDDLGEIPEDWSWLYFDLDIQYAEKNRLKTNPDHPGLAATIKDLYGVKL